MAIGTQADVPLSRSRLALIVLNKIPRTARLVGISRRVDYFAFLEAVFAALGARFVRPGLTTAVTAVSGLVVCLLPAADG